MLPNRSSAWRFTRRLDVRELRRKVVYSVLGLIPFFANFGIREMFQLLGAPLWAAGPVGYIAGGQINFLMHYGVTWGDRPSSPQGWRGHWRRYTVGNMLGCVVNTVAQLVCAYWLGFSPVLTFVVSVLASWPVNYYWNDKIAFPDVSPETP